MRLKHLSTFLRCSKTPIQATINDGGDSRNSRQLGWTAMNTPSSAVLDYVAVCGVLRYSRSVTVHRQCFPDCDDVDIRTLIVYNHIPELVNSMFRLFFCILSNMNCRATLHVDDDKNGPP